MRTFPVSAGLLEHKCRMGPAIWEFLWLINGVTSDQPDGSGHFTGIVRYGKPVNACSVATDLRESLDTAKHNLSRLEQEGYIARTLVRGAGYIYSVLNSKKWCWKRANGMGPGETPEFGTDDKGNALQDAMEILPAHRGENPSLTDEKNTRTRGEIATRNKESNTESTKRKQRAKHSSPNGKVDPRHSPVREEILGLWIHANPTAPAPPWNGKSAGILQKVLTDNPAWGVAKLLDCVRNRFGSEANHAADPSEWLSRLVSYASGPLDRFQKPKGSPNDENAGNGNRAQQRQAANLAAREAARRAVVGY